MFKANDQCVSVRVESRVSGRTTTLYFVCRFRAVWCADVLVWETLSDERVGASIAEAKMYGKCLAQAAGCVYRSGVVDRQACNA